MLLFMMVVQSAQKTQQALAKKTGKKVSKTEKRKESKLCRDFHIFFGGVGIVDNKDQHGYF